MWKEPVVGSERRMDLVVIYGKTKEDVIDSKSGMARNITSMVYRNVK